MYNLEKHVSLSPFLSDLNPPTARATDATPAAKAALAIGIQSTMSSRTEAGAKDGWDPSRENGWEKVSQSEAEKCTWTDMLWRPWRKGRRSHLGKGGAGGGGGKAINVQYSK